MAVYKRKWLLASTQHKQPPPSHPHHKLDSDSQLHNRGFKIRQLVYPWCTLTKYSHWWNGKILLTFGVFSLNSSRFHHGHFIFPSFVSFFLRTHPPPPSNVFVSSTRISNNLGFQPSWFRPRSLQSHPLFSLCTEFVMGLFINLLLSSMFLYHHHRMSVCIGQLEDNSHYVSSLK